MQERQEKGSKGKSEPPGAFIFDRSGKSVSQILQKCYLNLLLVIESFSKYYVEKRLHLIPGLLISLGVVSQLRHIKFFGQAVSITA